MQTALLVGLGGFVGTILRYGLGRIPIDGGFPLMTMAINILGSFLIGVIAGLAQDKEIVSPNTALFFQTGLCGGFTTFSAFSLETVVLIQNERYLASSAYVVLTVLLCLGATILGMVLVKK